LSVSGPCSPPGVGRRTALGGAAVLAALGPGPAAAAAPPAAPSLPALLRAVVDDRAAARALGRAHLAAGAEPGALRARLEALAAAAPRDAAGLRAAVREACARDLAAGDVAVVDGWVLARTEAEVLALIALA
jgi:hypothetical protein